MAVLLVRAGLDAGDGDGSATTRARTPTVATTTPRPGRTTPRGRPRFYRVKRGDTLESIAGDHDTNVETLLQLNPRVDPVALTVGQRIRVR